MNSAVGGTKMYCPNCKGIKSCKVIDLALLDKPKGSVRI